MSIKPTPSPLVIIALLASILLPQTALTQQRGPGASQTLTAGRYYALVIGNGDYISLPKLKTAAADARKVERVLRETYGFLQTTLLLNATRAQIVAALLSYRRELKADDNLLIYFAGHGYNDREADKAYWLPVDATRGDTSNWITAEEITTRIRVIPARHVLVISDSCYSGVLPSALGVSPSRPDERERYVQTMAVGHSRTLMASGSDEPVADDVGGNHSVFAAALLRGLRVADGPRFTATELFVGYVLGPVSSRTGQMPFYNPLRNSGHESGDFVFTRIKPAPVPGSCDDLETKAEHYKAFLDNYKGNAEQQKVAYEAGKDYVSRYERCPEESDKNIVGYIRHWLDKYEEAVRVWQRGQNQHP
jgi:hypothetical protein